MACFELPMKPQVFGVFFLLNWYFLAEILTWFYFCSSRTETMETDWCLSYGDRLVFKHWYVKSDILPPCKLT